MKKKTLSVIAAVLLLILIVGAIGIISRLVEKYTPTDERVELSEYFGVSAENEMALVLQDQILEEKGILEDGIAYLNYEVVKEYLNTRFYWDANESLMVYTTPTDVIEIAAGEQEYSVSGDRTETSYVIVKVNGGQAYIAADFVQQYTALDYEIYQEPARVVLTYQYGDVTRAELKKKSVVRTLGGIKSPIVTDVAKGDKVTVLEQMEDWTKVVTQDGCIGYIQNKRLGTLYTETLTTDFVEPEYTSIQKDYKINMVWHQVTSQESNYNLLQDIADVKGVNTISPTWFSIISNDGDISSLANPDYVTTAHGQNMEVWALVDNFSTEIDTTTVLSNTSSRKTLINQLVASAIRYDIDGINVDFEAIPEEAGDAYIQFLRELSVKCRKNGLVLSVDDPVPMDFNTHYHRDEQAEVVDYVIIMGYDEHYVGSDAGSVASLPFATAGVQNTLAAGVPAEKIVLGIPFYTRLWQTDSEGNVISNAYGMDTAEYLVSENGATATWDETTGQDYAEFTDGEGYFCQIWLENEASLEEKVKLVQEYGLGGVSAWKLGFERASVWDVLLKYVSN
ncbi:MAG: glycosyl hydrolase family 18 protein [Eubacteriales bacterium]|nr:glycosyl hydrolase family 18 protein [Eubacteriales bacterium]